MHYFHSTIIITIELVPSEYRGLYNPGKISADIRDVYQLAVLVILAQAGVKSRASLQYE